MTAEIPGNYDLVKMTVDMAEIREAANAINVGCNVIADVLVLINGKLNDLPAGVPWTGYAASTATAATSLWNDTMTKLYGTQSDILCSGIQGGCANYGTNEIAVGDMWFQFWCNTCGDPNGNFQEDANGNITLITPPASTTTPPNVTQDVVNNANLPFYDTAVDETF
jgi:hypothetical protein